MSCKEFDDFLMAYLDRELPAPQRDDFDAHLEACPVCVNYLESYRRTVALGRSICGAPEDPVPDTVPEELVAAILEARRR